MTARGYFWCLGWIESPCQVVFPPSEYQENENILLSASGDGSIKVWDVNAPPQANPLRSFEEHKHEVGGRRLAGRICAGACLNLCPIIPGQHSLLMPHLFLQLQAYCLHWNQVRRDCFLSGSWDDTIKLWNLESPHSLRTFAEHSYCVYAAQWCVPA